MTVARRAAHDVIRAGARLDDEADEQLIAALKQIARSKPHPALKKYGHTNTEVHHGYACIEFCTHPIHTAHGFTDMFFSEDWDVVEIRNSYDDDRDYDEEEEYIEGHEYPRRRPHPAGPSPKAEDAVWYALPDNSGQNPLNTKPVPLAEAVELLEQYLAHKELCK